MNKNLKTIKFLKKKKVVRNVIFNYKMDKLVHLNIYILIFKIFRILNKKIIRQVCTKKKIN